MSSEKSGQIKVGKILRYFAKKIFVSSDIGVIVYYPGRSFRISLMGVTSLISICLSVFSICLFVRLQLSNSNFSVSYLVCHFSPFVIPFSVVQRYQQKNALICSLTNRNANTFILIIIMDKKGFSIF